jgi:hypothetical protein
MLGQRLGLRARRVALGCDIRRCSVNLLVEAGDFLDRVLRLFGSVVKASGQVLLHLGQGVLRLLPGRIEGLLDRARLFKQRLGSVLEGRPVCVELAGQALDLGVSVGHGPLRLLDLGLEVRKLREGLVCRTF